MSGPASRAVGRGLTASRFGSTGSRDVGTSRVPRVPSQFNPVPSAGPFPGRCPDRTLVRHKSLPGRDYGRTPSIRPEETGAGTKSDSRPGVPTIRVPVPDQPACTGPWTHLMSVPINPVPRSESRPAFGPFPRKCPDRCAALIRWRNRPWTFESGRWTRRPPAGACPVPAPVPTKHESRPVVLRPK